MCASREVSRRSFVGIYFIDHRAYVSITELAKLRNVKRQIVWDECHRGVLESFRGNVTGCYYVRANMISLVLEHQLRKLTTVDTALVNVYGVTIA